MNLNDLQIINAKILYKFSHLPIQKTKFICHQKNQKVKMNHGCRMSS